MATRKAIEPPEHAKDIKEYEKSPWWTKQSRTILDDKEAVCEICGRKRWQWMPRKKKWKRLRFCVHHIRYTNCPNEQRKDLMVICWFCHDLFHLLFRLESWGGVFAKLAKIAHTVFFYEGNNTFKPW